VYSEYLQPEIETMPRDKLAALQERRLRRLVDHAFANSALYQERWNAVGATPADMASIKDFIAATPLLGKADLVQFREERNDPYCGLLCVPPHRVNNVGTSSGTTAEPMPLVELIDGAPAFASALRDMWGAGLRPGDRTLHVMATQRGPQERRYQAIGCVPLMVNLRQDADWPEVFAMIRRHRPSSLYTMGPMIADLDRLSHDYDLAEIFSSLKFAVVSGEPLGARMRERMTRDWGLVLYDVTGAADTGVAWECRIHDGYHLWDDYVLAESIDPKTGAPVPDGEVGELVCTALANLGWPLIRHRSGDMVRMTHEPCRCGRTHTRFHLLGRLSDKLTIAGTSFMPSQIREAIEACDETAAAIFQIIFPDHENLSLRIGYNPRRCSDAEALRSRLETAVERAVGLRPTIELLEETVLLSRSPSGIKLPRVVPK
jgi:phenylacetate-CoA ligase